MHQYQRIVELDTKNGLILYAINHVKAGGPSVLLIHCTADENVLPEQSSTFAELYRRAGGQVELVLLQKAPHPFWNYAPWFEDTMNRAAAFFHRVANELQRNAK